MGFPLNRTVLARFLTQVRTSLLRGCIDEFHVQKFTTAPLQFVLNRVFLKKKSYMYVLFCTISRKPYLIRCTYLTTSAHYCTFASRVPNSLAHTVLFADSAANTSPGTYASIRVDTQNRSVAVALGHRGFAMIRRRSAYPRRAMQAKFTMVSPFFATYAPSGCKVM